MFGKKCVSLCVQVSLQTKKCSGKCSIQSVCITTAWQHTSLEVAVKGFKKCCMSSAVDGTDDDMLWNGSVEGGSVRSVRKMKALSVKMEPMTLIGTGR